MLFRKDIEPQCTYCRRGRPLNRELVACPKRGVVAADDHCRAFRYDPLKRVPPRPVALQTRKFQPSDFSL